MVRFGTSQFRLDGSVSALQGVDARRLLASSMIADETVLWGVPGGERLVDVREPASHLALVGEGRQLLLAFARVTRWDALTGKELPSAELEGLKAPMVAGAHVLAAYDAARSRVCVRTHDGQAVSSLDLECPTDLALFDSESALAIARGDGGLIVLDVGTGRRRLEDPRPHRKVTASKDGQWLLCAGGDSIELRRGGAGRQVWSTRDVSDVDAVALSPNATVAALLDWRGRLQLRSLSDGRALAEREVPLHGGCIAFVNDDVLAYGWAGAVRFAAVPSLKDMHEPQGHEASVIAVCQATDVVVTASRDQDARVWDARTGGARRLLHHDNAVEDCALSPSGTRVASVSADGRFRLWDPARGEVLHESALGIGLDIGSVAFSPDGTLVATLRAKSVDVLQADLGEPRSTFAASAPSAIRFLDDQRLLLVQTESLRVVGLDGAPGALLQRRFEPPLAVAPDGSRCALRRNDRLAIYECAALDALPAPDVHLPTALAWSRDGVLACARFQSSDLLLWDSQDASVAGTLAMSSRPTALAFVDERRLLVGMANGTAEIVVVPKTKREIARDAARLRDERVQAARALMYALSRDGEPVRQEAGGYRVAPGRDSLSPDGLALECRLTDESQIAIRCHVHDDYFRFEIARPGTAPLPPPNSAFVRLGRWLRARLGHAPPPPDPRDEAWLARIQAEPGVFEATVDRLEAGSTVLTFCTRELPEPRALWLWLQRAAEVLRE
ncbi:MAG: PQQ-binding-like beta-propeller repeat protein [Polyangiaceae bacterium]